MPMRVGRIFRVLILSVLLIGTAHAQDDFARARTLYHQYRFQEALPLFQKFVREHPNHVMGRYYLAMCHIRLRHWQAALREINRVLERRPGMIQARAAKIFVLVARGQIEAAEEVLAEARKRAPQHVDLDFAEGVLYSYRKDYARAIEMFQRVLQRRPRDAYAHYYKGLCHYHIQQYDLAIESFETFLELAPNAPEAPQVRELLQRLQG